MKTIILTLLLTFLAGVLTLDGQQKVPELLRYERVIAVVPMIGKGTYEDPRRPMLTHPGGRSVVKTDEPQILEFKYELSADGERALVEFVVRDYQTFCDHLGQQVPGAKVFRRGFTRKADIETEFRKVKPGFSLDKFLGVNR